MTGVATSNLPTSTTVDDVLGNSGGNTRRITIDRLVALIAALMGPTYAQRSQLFADLGWPAGSIGYVRADGTTAFNGVYKKSGNSGGGSWSRIGDLPTGALELSLLDDIVVALNSFGVRAYGTRADAEANAQALPSGITHILTVESYGLAVRARTASSVDPLFPSGARWGVARRLSSIDEVQAMLTSETGPLRSAVNTGGPIRLSSNSYAGGSNTYSAAIDSRFAAIGLTDIGDGAEFLWIAPATNAGPNPSLTIGLNVSRGMGRGDGSTLPTGWIVANRGYVLRRSGSQVLVVRGDVTHVELAAEASARAATISTVLDATARVRLVNVTQVGDTIFGEIPAALAALGVTPASLTRVQLQAPAVNTGTNVRLSINGLTSVPVRTYTGDVVPVGGLFAGPPLTLDLDPATAFWRITSTERPPNVQIVDAPAIRRSTSAEFVAHEHVDFGGGLHLPSLGGVSVQDHFRRAYRQIGETDGKAQRAIDSILARRRVYDAVIDFGIPNDGITNGRTQIQAAIDFVSASALASGPGVIYFPPGVYRIEGGSVEPRSNVILQGAGWGRARFMPTAQHAMFRRDQNPQTLFRFSMFDVEIDCSGQGGGGPSARTKGTYIIDYEQCFFERVYCHDAWATGLGNDFGREVWYTDCLVKDNGRGTPDDVIAGGSSGIGLGTGRIPEERVIVSRCVCEGNRNNGAFVERQGGGLSVHKAVGVIFSELISRNNAFGITDAGCSGMIIANCQLYNNNEYGIALDRGTLSASPSAPAPHPGEFTKIVGNSIFGNTLDGIFYDGVGPRALRGIQTSGNSIYRNGRDGISLRHHPTEELIGTQISGDYVAENGRDGIRLRSGAFAGLAIKGATIVDNLGAGITLNAQIRGGRIFGNEIYNTVSGSALRASITGTGALTSVDIAENHGVGVSPIALTGAQTGVTFGRNPGI